MEWSKLQSTPTKTFLTKPKESNKRLHGCQSLILFSHQSLSLSSSSSSSLQLFFFFLSGSLGDRQTHQWKTRQNLWKGRTQVSYHLQTATAPTVAAAVAATAMDSTTRQLPNLLPDPNRILTRQPSFKQTPPPSSKWSKCSPDPLRQPNRPRLPNQSPIRGPIFLPSKRGPRSNQGSSSTRGGTASRTSSSVLSYLGLFRTILDFLRGSPRYSLLACLIFRLWF